ncbi:MAG: hypothetical protein K0R18_367 [Bacillales bacterium]|jgi:hypothetical protein|nr:hypothetical protein [Bacillales bacterium]
MIQPVYRNDSARELYEQQKKTPLIKPVEQVERLVNNANKNNQKGKHIDIKV